MRRVVDKQTVAHLWANREQDNANTPTGNLYFERDCIYSYGSHFMIAKHVENAEGERAILMTRRTYSKTTSAQVQIVRQASRHIRTLFVPDPDKDSRDLFEQWYTDIRRLADQIAKARKLEKYIGGIADIFREVKAYADFFGYQIPQYLAEAGQIQNEEQYRDVLGRETEMRRVQAEKERIQKLKVQKERLKLWRNFKTNRLSTVDGFDYLRYNVQAERVETSQHVEIPAEIARRFYAFILKNIASGGCRDCGFSLMDRYAVSEINKDFIRVGCHKISLKEIKSFTKKQGWV